jgi:DMSO reductase anchor subunit
LEQLVVPGIFFIYDMSPFLVEVHHKSKPFLHVLTRILAIAGGVLSVLGLVDGLVYRVQTLVSKKL